MRIHHSAPHDPASFVYHTHRRPLETNVQSCKHPHRCSPSFARGITSGKDRLPAGEQQPHVWDVLAWPRDDRPSEERSRVEAQWIGRTICGTKLPNIGNLPKRPKIHLSNKSFSIWQLLVTRWLITSRIAFRAANISPQ